MLKKMINVIFIVAMMFNVTACQNKETTEKQEKIVMDFFAYMSKGELNQAESIMTKSGYKAIKIIKDTIDKGFLGEQQNNKVVKKEVESYTQYFYKNLFKDMSIEEAQLDGDDTFISVKGMIMNYESISKELEDIDYEELLKDFFNDPKNKEQMINLYHNQGEEASDVWVMEQTTPIFFKEYRRLLDECEYQEVSYQVHLIRKDDTWLINNIR